MNTTDAYRLTLTLLNHAMSIYGLDQQYEIGFGGDPTKDEDTDRSPFVRVMDCGDPLRQYYFDANGVINSFSFAQETEEIDYEFYNNLGRMNKGRALEDFDMFDRERETK
jgi:hypothetical protein